MHNHYIAVLPGDDIYAHLAQEEALLGALPDGGAAMLLWRGRSCVVIGRNQNAFTQCDIDRINADGVLLARRRTGGGAVYHDMGNLCFSFITNNAGRGEFIDCVADAISALGIPAERRGNDIEVNECKFSGNAFMTDGTRKLHHGTLLVDSDLNALASYLKPSELKLKAKGVESVRARVVNLISLLPGITNAAVIDALMDSFSKQYPDCCKINLSDEELALAKDAEARYRSHEWIYGQALPFSARIECRRDSGTFVIDADIENGLITRCAVDTDARDAVRASGMAGALIGMVFERGAIEAAIDGVMHGD